MVAKSREALVREKGAKWAADAIPVFGQELINIMKTEELGDPAIACSGLKVAKLARKKRSVFPTHRHHRSP